jgi:hypothetical protein
MKLNAMQPGKRILAEGSGQSQAKFCRDTPFVGKHDGIFLSRVSHSTFDPCKLKFRITVP